MSDATPYAYEETNSIMAPARARRLVVPSDSTDLPDGACRSFYLPVGGTVSFICKNDDDTVTTPVVFAAGYHPWRVRRFRSTGTTGSLVIWAIY